MLMIFKRVLLVCVTPLNTEFFPVWLGPVYGNQKQALLHSVTFDASKLDISMHSFLRPYFSLWRNQLASYPGVLECYMSWFPSLICNNYIFRHSVHENWRSYIPEILYCTTTCNFTSGADNRTIKIRKFVQCACADLCSVKWRNGNSSTCFRKLKF